MKTIEFQRGIIYKFSKKKLFFFKNCYYKGKKLMTTTMNGVFNSDTDSNSPNTPASASTEVNTVNVPTPPQNNPNGIGIHSGLESLNETLNVQFNNDIDIDITGKKQNTKTNTSLNMSTSTNTNTKKNKKTKKMIRIPKKIVEEATRTDETTTRTTETAQAFSTTQTTPGGAVNAETNEEKEGAQAQIPQTQKPPLVGGAANVEINETPSRSNGNSFHTGLTQPMNNVTMNNVNVNNIGTSVEKQDTSMIKENGDSTIAQNSIPNTTNTNTNGNPNENDNKNDSKTNITNDTGNDIEEEEEEDIDIDITMISASNTAPSTTTTINPTTTTGNSNSNSNPTTNDNTNLNTNETKTTDEKDDLKLESNTDANDTVMTTLDSDINSNNTATRPDVTSNIASNDLSARLEALYNSTERKEADTVMQAVAQKAGTHMIQICNDLKEDILDQCDDFGLEMRKEMEKWTLTRSWVQVFFLIFSVFFSHPCTYEKITFFSQYRNNDKDDESKTESFFLLFLQCIFCFFVGIATKIILF